MTRITGLFIILFFFASFAEAQNKMMFDLKIKKGDFKTEKESGFKEAWKSLKIARDYFEAGTGTYALAREHYLKAHQYNSENEILNFKLGICYLYTDDKYEALKYMRKAYDRAPDLHPDINYYLGRAYHLVLNFDKAIENYQKQREKLINRQEIDKISHIDKLIKECNNGKEIVREPRRVIIMNMGDSVNSTADDYFSVFTKNDSVVYFTSRRYHEKRNKRNPYDNKYFEDVYVSELTENGWTDAQPVSGKINTKGRNESIAGIGNNGENLFIYKGHTNGGDVYTSHYNEKKNHWNRPKPISRQLRSKQTEGSVFFTSTGDTIYFISANEELTNGGKDIMMSVKDPKGRWQDPANLGSLVNTEYDEEGIYLTPDGDHLYFSSKGHNTMGGYDIFHSEKLEDGTWSDPDNLGYPINTADDDLFFVLSEDGKYGYFSAIRESGVGAKDLFKIVFLGSEKELIITTEDILVAGLDDTVKTGFFHLPSQVEIDSFYYLTGRVLDKKTNDPVFAKMEFIDIDNSEVVATAISADSGKYKVKFPKPKNYGVEIIAKDYLFYLDAIDLTSASSDVPVENDFFIEKVEVGTKVILENIYFETGKATLKPDSYTQLNQIIEFLENNETIKLEISGHTDNTGSLRINTKLSEDRAKAVVDYLVANGVEAGRLEWKGYAYSQPVAPNDTPEGREKNRRVEFKVLSK